MATDTTWYRFTAATGEPIGYSSEEIVPTPDGGRDVIDTQQVIEVMDVPRDARAPRRHGSRLPGAVRT